MRPSAFSVPTHGRIGPLPSCGPPGYPCRQTGDPLLHGWSVVTWRSRSWLHQDCPTGRSVSASTSPLARSAHASIASIPGSAWPSSATKHLLRAAVPTKG